MTLLTPGVDDEDDSAEVRSDLRELVLAKENAAVRIELGNCVVPDRDAPARTYGCVSLAVTKIVLDGSRASSKAH